MAVVPGFSVSELWAAGRKAKRIYDAFFGEYDNAPDRIKELVNTCSYLNHVLGEVATILEEYGDTYSEEQAFRRKLQECETFISDYSTLKRSYENEEVGSFSFRVRQSFKEAWQTGRFAYADKRAQALQNGLSLEIQKVNTFMFMFALRRTLPVDRVSSSGRASERAMLERAQIRERLERPSRFALAATGQISVGEYINEEVLAESDLDYWFERLLRLRSLWQRSNHSEARPENLEPILQLLESIWYALWERARTAMPNRQPPPLPRDSLRLLEAPTQNFNDLILDLAQPSAHLRGRANPSLLSPPVIIRPQPRLQPITPLSEPEHTSHSSSLWDSPRTGRESFSSPEGCNSNSAPSYAAFYGPRSVPSLDLPPSAMGSHVATITLFPDTARPKTLDLHRWKCRTKSGYSLEQVDWLGMNGSDLLSHQMPSGAFPQIPHSSEDPQQSDLIFIEENDWQNLTFDSKEGRLHDKQRVVEYRFLSTELRDRFHGDLLNKRHVASFNMDVISSDSIPEKNKMGAVEGIATLETLHVWKDIQWPYRHTLSFIASKTTGRVEEYHISLFNSPPERAGTVVILERCGKKKEHRSSASQGSSSGRKPSMLRRFTRSSVSEEPPVSPVSVAISPTSPNFPLLEPEIGVDAPKKLKIKFTTKSGKNTEAKRFYTVFTDAWTEDQRPAEIKPPPPGVSELSSDTQPPVEMSADRDSVELNDTSIPPRSLPIHSGSSDPSVHGRSPPMQARPWR